MHTRNLTKKMEHYAEATPEHYIRATHQHVLQLNVDVFELRADMQRWVAQIEPLAANMNMMLRGLHEQSMPDASSKRRHF